MGSANSPDKGESFRTFFLGVVVAILVFGFIAEKADIIKNGVEYAIYAILIYTVVTFFLRRKAQIEKARLEEEMRKVLERRRLEEERKRLKTQSLLDEEERKKKAEAAGETQAETIKGKHYAKIVGAAFIRLGYDVVYRDIDIDEDNAVHLIATRANELCLIHCSQNQIVVEMAEIEVFILDCATFIEHNKFWQDDVKYIYVFMSAISDEAIDYINEERKNRTPIEYRVITA
ncbi:MAG: hypothetical protein LBI57_00800 [Helicobacteraceae bacterium]|jgi:hypothetical protein|nr:hypothetical protein [Helicobacteraceae bacterium]